MVGIARLLAFQYPTARPLVDYVVQQDTNAAGEYLAQWNPALGPQPTPADLATIVASPAFVTWITPAATQARIDALQPERTTLRAQAVQAVADCETFLALAAPTTPQVLAAVRRLCQIAEALIKYAAVQP